MAHEVLTVKLCQLDDRLARLHSRNHMSETADHGRLRREIDALKEENAESGTTLRNSLYRSRAPLAGLLAQNYEEIERSIESAVGRLQARRARCPDPESAVEDKILLAEYALDFAQQAADRALLIALEAIDAQLLWQRQEGRTQ